MATHSSVLAWRIPGTGEPGGLPSMGSHRVGHDWSDLAAAAAAVVLRHLCPTLCDSMDCSPPGSSVHGTSQAGMLEWIAISHSRESSNTSIKPTAPKPPALAGAPFTTEPPGKPLGCLALFLLRPRSPVTCWVQSWFSYCSDILRTSKQVMTWPLCDLPPKCLPCQRGHDVIHAHQN